MDTNMTFSTIEEEVLYVYKILEESGHEIYLVGGCVRDLMIKKNTSDWDLTTNATPEEIQKLFPRAFYDNSFGTVGIPFSKEYEDIEKNIIEITTFRSEKDYLDNRHPSKVVWGTSIHEDLSRRDFTVNAIALRLKTYTSLTIENSEIIDPYNGQQDIEKKVIRAVRNPNERFKEDALRIMRAIRFTSQLGFTIEENTWNAILEDAPLISNISGERIRDELFKILSTENYYRGIETLDKSKILAIIFPELEKGKGVNQARPGRHHTTDVFTHNMLSLKECPSVDPLVRLATLLHDVGKPFVQGTDDQGYIIFYNHEVKGAKIAGEIADRLRLSKKQKEKMMILIRWHMFTVDENITDSAIRRFIRRVGVENVADIIDLRIGDRLGSGTKTAESWRLREFKERIVKELNPPFSINDLAINGTDVMKELNILPGPKVGKILKAIFEEVDEDLSRNNRELLLQKIHEVAVDIK